jgi:hypothetical protein
LGYRKQIIAYTVFYANAEINISLREREKNSFNSRNTENKRNTKWRKYPSLN